jgi:disulfide bond formation protein DsbB
MDKASYYLRRERHRLIILAVVSLALIGGALYLQVFQHEDPCPLCILQRYAYLLIAVFALAGAAARGWRGVRIAEVLILLASLGGIVTAARHVWVQAKPAFGCGFDALEPVVDSLPLAKILPSVFKVSGLCETLYPPIFGLLLPQWALLGFVLIFVLIARSLARRGQYQRA